MNFDRVVRAQLLAAKTTDAFAVIVFWLVVFPGQHDGFRILWAVFFTYPAADAFLLIHDRSSGDEVAEIFK